MNLYMFEYLDTSGATRQQGIRAVDSLDAFSMFRADHPAAPIADVWPAWQAVRVEKEGRK